MDSFNILKYLISEEPSNSALTYGVNPVAKKLTLEDPSISDNDLSTELDVETKPVVQKEKVSYSWDDFFNDLKKSNNATETTSQSQQEGPRGRRNNNWGNIRLSTTPWEGKVTGTDTAFETFNTPENGVRAAAKQIMTYIKRGKNTIQDIISTWAPSNENNTSGYISRVSAITGYKPEDIVEAKDYDKIKNLLKAMFQVELGQQLTSADERIIDRAMSTI